MSENFGVSQSQLLAAADVLWRSQIIKPEVEPTAVMLTIANMLRAAYKYGPTTPREQRDLDPVIAGKLFISG